MTIRTRNWSPGEGVAAIASVGLLATACFAENVKSDFPPGLDPLEAVDPALCPQGTLADPYPEQIATSFVQPSGSSLIKAYGCGYIKRPLADVWAAGTVPQTASEPTTGVTRCSIALNVETGYDASWRFHNSYDTGTVAGTLVFDITWRAGTLPWPTPTTGPGTPLTYAWRFQKTDGTAYIKELEGSLVAYEVTGQPGITKVELVRYVDAPTTWDKVVGGVQNHYDNIMAKLANPTAPVWTNRVCTGP